MVRADVSRHRLFAGLVCVVPAVSVAGLLLAPVPVSWYSAVEVAGYFQTLAIVRDGLASYTYLTPVESDTGLHLHSLLSAPILAAGVLQAGRIVSLLAAVAAAGVVFLLGAELFDSQTGLLAAALLWVHPLFITMASRWWTASLSIALTAGIVYATVRSVRSEESAMRRRWIWVGCGLMIAGISNHVWEASIALVPVVYYLYLRRYASAAAVTMVTAGAVVAVRGLVRLQPDAVNLASAFGIHENVDTLLSLAWLFQGPLLPRVHPVDLATSLTIPLVVIVLSGLCLRALTYHQAWRPDIERAAEPTLLLSSWLAAGLSVPVLLPGGWLVHDYYLWGVLAPLSVTLAWATVTVIERVRCLRSDQAIRLVTVILVLAASSYGLVILSGVGGLVVPPAERGVENVEPTELTTAAASVRTMGVTNADQITFVGDWSEHRRTVSYTYNVGLPRVVVHSGVMIREWELGNDRNSRGPRVVTHNPDPEQCRVAVVKTPARVHAQSCSALAET